MLRRRAAAASGYVEYAPRGHGAHLRGHLSGRLVIFPHLVRKSGVGVAQDPAGGEAREFLDQRGQLLRTQRAVESEGP